ncbi:hypothetical protein LPJ66_003014 [Kickxella alabastrina]|uniref:Uncharacterized protein n=1 Tax=Kickxella alabastrina TaxID=61397 RepID=A0ACC1ILS4_9FUNG|nr:hypothetical protein LPJ66_003014 [Kickxella alabastrina]
MPTTPKIVFYFDVLSVFSYIGFEFMEKYTALWGIEVEYRPFNLGQVMRNTKNMLSPNKGPFLITDARRTSSITKIPFKGEPTKFPYNSITALCTLQYLKTHHPWLMVPAMRRLWRMEYVERRAPESADDIKQGLDGLVDARVVEEAISVPDTLEAVKQNTADVEQMKGFGAPTILVYKKGESEPQMYFGSDRFEHIAIYLDKEFYPMKQLFSAPKI